MTTRMFGERVERHEDDRLLAAAIGSYAIYPRRRS
jgi:hypothetical protein